MDWRCGMTQKPLIKAVAVSSSQLMLVFSAAELGKVYKQFADSREFPSTIMLSYK